MHVPWQRLQPLRWPMTSRLWLHVVVAGLLMHAADFSASHGAHAGRNPAGITALLPALRPALPSPTSDLNAAAPAESLASLWHDVLASSITNLATMAPILGISAPISLRRRVGVNCLISVMYLPPPFAVTLERPFFDIAVSAITPLSATIACAAVALVRSRRR